MKLIMNRSLLLSTRLLLRHVVLNPVVLDKDFWVEQSTCPDEPIRAKITMDQEGKGAPVIQIAEGQAEGSGWLGRGEASDLLFQAAPVAFRQRALHMRTSFESELDICRRRWHPIGGRVGSTPRRGSPLTLGQTLERDNALRVLQALVRQCLVGARGVG